MSASEETSLKGGAESSKGKQVELSNVAESNEAEISGDDEPGAGSTEDAVATTAKPKKSKKAKIKKALGVGSKDGDPGSSSNPVSKLTPNMVEQLLEMNPSLKGEVAGMNKEKAAEILKKLEVADLLTGMVRLLNPTKIFPH